MKINAFTRGAGKALGAVRKSTSSKSKEFAHKIGAGDSLWRMVESGNAPLGAAYVLPFIQLCPEVSFLKFSVIHLMCKIFDAEEPENQDKCCEILSVLEPKLQRALEAYSNKELAEEEKVQQISEQIKIYLMDREEEDFRRVHSLLTNDPTLIQATRNLLEKISGAKI